MRQNRTRPVRTSTAGRARVARKGTLALDIAGEGTAWTCLGEDSPAAAARRVARAMAAWIELPAARCAATLLLSHDAHVRVLNRQWRGFDKPTNVLSFPAALPPGSPATRTRHLGDIVLAEETLVREARDMGLEVGDHFRHLVLHGLLHLLGYDHETDTQAEEMETLETSILATLGIADPYAGTAPIHPKAAPRPASGRTAKRRAGRA